MTNRLIAPPRPPAQLWGLWAVTDERPDGFWWNHTNAAQSNGVDDAPMTFVSRDDALATAAADRAAGGRDLGLSVALIGVAPESPL